MSCVCQRYFEDNAALHYKELEFIAEPLAGTIEALISINHQLQQPDSAIGILEFAQQNHDIELKESWYEKLQRWEEGLKAYEKKSLEEPHNVEAIRGRMRCLHNREFFFNPVGEWESLHLLAQERWEVSSASEKSAIAPMAAAAAWGLNEYERMQVYVDAIQQAGPDLVFFKAVLALHGNQYDKCLKYIEATRAMLDTELTALVGESYNRAYYVVVRIQMLAELEEIMAYKQMVDEPEKQRVQRLAWDGRLEGCQRNVEVWQRILKVRALVIPPREDKSIWITFANLCRNSSRMGLAQKTLIGLMDVPVSDFGSDEVLKNDPFVVYACIKHLWASGAVKEAFEQMKRFTVRISGSLGISGVNDMKRVSESGNPLMPLLARGYLKIGTWQQQTEWNADSIPEILESYRCATACDLTFYKSHHAWAAANFEVLSFYEHDTSQLLTYTVDSITGFFFLI